MLDDLDPQSCTNARLRKLTRTVTCHYEHHLRVTGLKNTQLALLSHVIALGPIRPGDLAKQMQLDDSTLTRNMQALVAKGWLVIGKGCDARSRIVNITEAGRTKRAEGHRHWKQAQQALNAKLGTNFLAELHGLLDACIQRLQDAEGRTAISSTRSGERPTQNGQAQRPSY
jgi:DNA-binding MarR family transcriptional regulator